MNQQGDAASQGRLEEFHRKHRVAMLTMLFTDVVGSTRLKIDLGELRAIEIMERHHETVRAVLADFPDAEEISTAGDSFFLVFVRPSEAVHFALKLQGALRTLSRELAWPISDRIGIHVGEVFIQHRAGQGNEFFGIQIDTSSRIMALGGRDQILLSRFAYENARQTLRRQKISGVGELSWVSHGFYDLKDVEEPVEICEVGEIGLAMLAPPSIPGVETSRGPSFTTLDGRSFRNATFRVTDAGLNVVTPDGGALVSFNQLPSDLSCLPPKVREDIANAKRTQVFKIQKPQPSAVPATPALTRFERAVLQNYTILDIVFSRRANADAEVFVPAFTDYPPPSRVTSDASVLKTVLFINQNIKARDRIIYYDTKINTFVCGRVGFCPKGRIRILYDECSSFDPADLNPDQIEIINHDDHSLSIGVKTMSGVKSIVRRDGNASQSMTHSFVLPVENHAAARVMCKAVIHFISLYRRP